MQNFKIIKIKNNSVRRNGFSLVTALITMSFLSALLLALYSFNLYYINSSKLEVMRTQALALAEGGIDKALHELSYNSTYSGETDLTILSNPGVADVTVESPDSATRIVTSQSYIPSKLNTQMTRKLKVTAVADPNISGNAFTFAVQAGEGGFYGEAKKNPNIHGSIFSNQNVQILGPGSNVDGNIDAVSDVDVRGHVGGTITEGVEPVPLPSVDIEYWQQEAQNTGSTHEGDLIISDNGNHYLGGENNISVINGRLLIVGNANIFLEGPVWIKGTGGSSIEISANPRFYISAELTSNKTIILCDGKIAISGNARIESQKPDAWVLLISTYPGSLDFNTSSIVINANVHLEDTILYGYNGAIEFAQNSSGVFAGAFVAQKIIIKSNLSLDYQSGLGSISFEQAQAPDGGGFTLQKGSFAELIP